MSIQSAGRACSCGFLVDKCLHIRQTRQTRRASENVNRANMESAGREDSAGQLIRDGVADGRHHCNHRHSSCSARTRVTPAQRVHQRQLLLRHLQQLFELQEIEAGYMLTVGLDFGKHSKTQLRPPLAQSRSSATSDHTVPTSSRRQPRPDRPRLPSDTCLVNSKLLDLWSFERHCSHTKRDRKRTAHVSTSTIERVSHRTCRLLSARMCSLPSGNVCLRGLLFGSESHLAVA